MAKLAFEKGETISIFVGRCDRIVGKASATSDGIEALMKPATVLTYLNKVFSHPGEHGPEWFVPFWTIQ